MSIITDLRDRYLVTPVAKRIIDNLSQSATPVEKADVAQVFSVPLGFNNSMSANNKRNITGAVDFQVLRNLSTAHETTRAAINTRKRQITQLAWDIVDASDDTDPEHTLDERQQVRNIISNIGGDGVRFREILDKLIEDTLVLDACVFYKQRTRGGQLLRIIPVDGATIKLRVGDGGERPLPPEFAFEQWIFGKKVADLTTKDMTYEMMNPRTNSPYGLSPLESLMLTVDASMRATLYNLGYLSDNNVPQGFLEMPENWTVDQIKEYREFFDSMISSPKQQAKVFPIPSGANYTPTSKPSDFSFKDFFDYLDRKVCALFDIQPQELGLQLQQYKENADGQDKIQLRRGIKPLANFLQEIFTDIVQKEYGYTGFAFKFVGLPGKYNPEDAKTLIPIGVLGVDEVRNDMGLKKLGVEPFIINGNTVTPLSQLETQPDGSIPLLDQQEADRQARADALAAGNQNDQQNTDNKEKTPAPAKKVAKKGKNLSFEKVTRTKNFKLFKKAVASGIEDTIKPFTKEAKIADVNKLEKAVADNIPDEDLQVVIDGLDEFLKWSAEQGGQTAYSALGIKATFKLTNDKFQEMLGDREQYIIDSVSGTTKDWLVETIANGKAEGLTNSEIADQIASESEDIIQSRADTIVNTEVANAMQTSELDTYAEQGIEEKTWVTSEDNLVEEECAALDGETVKIDEEFSSGDDAPPLHPNCRCYIQAVINDQPTDDIIG